MMTLEEAYHVEDQARRTKEAAAEKWERMEKFVEAARHQAQLARADYERACSAEKLAQERIVAILYPNGVK